MGRLKDMAQGKDSGSTPAPAPAPVEVKAAAAAPKTAEETVRIKASSGRRWWMVWAGAGMVVASFLGIFNLPLGENQILAFFVIAILVSGGVCIYFGLKKNEEKLTYLTAAGKKVKKVYEPGKEPNSLNIYPNKVDFEYEEHPLGMPWRSLDLSGHFYVHEKNNGSMKEFRLPDADETQRYYDPKEYANVVTMPLNKKYFSWSPSTIKMIAMGLMVVIIVAELIGLVVIGGK